MLGDIEAEHHVRVAFDVGEGGLAAGDQDGVRRGLAVDERLPGATRAELYEVVVALGHRYEAGEKEQLEAAVVVGGFEADGADYEVGPLLGGELCAPLDVLLEVE